MSPPRSQSRMGGAGVPPAPADSHPLARTGGAGVPPAPADSHLLARTGGAGVPPVPADSHPLAPVPADSHPLATAAMPARRGGDSTDSDKGDRNAKDRAAPAGVDAGPANAGARPPAKPLSRQPSRPPSRPSSRPPAAGVVLQQQPVPLGADPLGALAASRQPAPPDEAGKVPLPKASPPLSAGPIVGKRSKSSQPTPRTSHSAEPAVRRSGSVEPLHPLRAGLRGPPKAPPKALDAPLQLPRAGWSGLSGDAGAPAGVVDKTRRRAAQVAAGQSANAKDREDSLLRMLDNRQQRARAVV